uniref:Uncharacterized protein n=1 Tax=Chlamydomonas euryale TaxID=1486919 RepID=A0A7R9VLU0_9CHLO|mmetsp:Transcript_38794/g.115358  ORF Transcript_38794/g.115358 Transcript_38794/m.115358 type:complete len:447 (+) Transcript_38794:517-1857(+)
MQALPGAGAGGIGRNNGSASGSGSPRGGGSGTECGGLPLQLPTERSDHPRDPSEDNGDDLVEEKIQRGFSLQEWWEKTVASSKLYLERHSAVKHFLHATKSGDTGSALLCLANQPFLLAYHTFAKDGDTVWHLLAEYGDTSLLSALTNFCKIHPPPKRFHKAKYMTGGRVDRDAMILRFMNATNRLKQTPLMFAAYHGRDEVIRFLLRNGADAWSKDRCGSRSALHYASMRGHAACVHALLEALPESQKERNGLRYVDVQSASGFTPLHFGISVDSLQVTRALLAFDACIDMFNVFDAGEFWLSCVTRSTALHLCAISNRIYCAGAILHYWEQNRVALKLEDPRLWRDAKGRLPVEIAQVKGHEALEKALVPGADVRPLKQYMPEISDSVVLRLKAIAAQVLKEQMVASIKEAEEFMKLLGTYQQHGRVFARRAYDAQSVSGGCRV